MNNTITIKRVTNGTVVTYGTREFTYGRKKSARALLARDLRTWLVNPNAFLRKLEERAGERRFKNTACTRCGS